MRDCPTCPTGPAIAGSRAFRSSEGFIYGGDLSYCRVPRRCWKERMLQMKAAGLNTVTVYPVWAYHQEKRDVLDFAGERDLAAFLDTVAECGMYCIFRIGPFVHGEFRNGGLTQWIVDELGTAARTNDPEYLTYADILLRKERHRCRRRGTITARNG